MPEKEPSPGKISSFFGGFAESANATALMYKRGRTRLNHWTQEGLSSPEKATRQMIVFIPKLLLKIGEKGTIFIGRSSQAVANINKNRL